MAERETTAWNVVKALQPPENKGRRVFDGCLMGGGFASCLLPQKSLDNMTPNQAGFVKMNFVNRTSHSGLPPFGFVNGLLLVVIELKEPGVPARAAFDENLTHYKQQIPVLFWFNAVLIASNGTSCRVGSLTADWEVFAHGHLLRVEAHRARGRAAPGVAGGDAARDVRPGALASGQVELAEEDQFHPNGMFHQPVKHGKGLK